MNRSQYLNKKLKLKKEKEKKVIDRQYQYSLCFARQN